eukprot:10725226-Ditylum_brightwellii.AAC.1
MPLYTQKNMCWLGIPKKTSRGLSLVRPSWYPFAPPMAPHSCVITTVHQKRIGSSTVRKN